MSLPREVGGMDKSTEAIGALIAAEIPQFERVQVRRGFQHVASQIRREIQAGRLVPGDRLPSERAMADQFGVSRQVVREALRTLEESGLIVSRVGVAGGAFVKQGDPSVVSRGFSDLASVGRLSPDDVLEARLLMTTTAIRLAIQRGAEEDFEELEQDILHTEALTQSGELERRSTQIVNFYRILGRATHNDVYSLLIDALTEIVQIRLDAVSQRPKTDVVQVRRTVLDAMKRRDADAACDAMVVHLNELERHLREQEATQQSKTAAVRSETRVQTEVEGSGML